MTELKQRILPTVQKPARYTGGEWGEIKKELAETRVRVAFCFPDTYEIGMSNVGMRILYGVIQNAQLHQFDNVDFGLQGDQQDNLKLLMGVPLEISVEIGTAKRKVKDILDFTQGTIIELERQAGAPVDVVVNGNLIARGDVVVIDDNFAVRITEIVKSKFMDSLGKE